MKLLLTTLDYEGAGGIQTLAQSLVSGLRRNGHTVEVLVADSALGSSDAESGVSNPESLEVGCDVRQQWLNQTDHDDLRSWLQGNRLYRRTREAIEEEEYDIIHALHINCWPSLVAAPADTATVLSVHALELRDTTTSLLAFGQADTIHAVSRFTANLVTEMDPTTADKIVVVHPMIAVEEYQQESVDTSTDNDRCSLLPVVAADGGSDHR